MFSWSYVFTSYLPLFSFFIFFPQDKFLSEDELVKHYKVFAGSRVTRYGDLLRVEL